MLPAAARAKGVIGLAQRGDDIGQGLEGANDLLHENARGQQREEGDEAKENGGHRPRNLRAPQQDGGEHKCGSCDENTQGADAAFEGGVAVWVFAGT